MVDNINIGLVAIAAALSIISVIATSIGESMIVVKTLENVARNPEASDKARSLMIIGIALVETCALYALIVAILIIFKLGV